MTRNTSLSDSHMWTTHAPSLPLHFASTLDGSGPAWLQTAACQSPAMGIPSGSVVLLPIKLKNSMTMQTELPGKSPSAHSPYPPHTNLLNLQPSPQGKVLSLTLQIYKSPRNNSLHPASFISPTCTYSFLPFTS